MKKVKAGVDKKYELATDLPYKMYGLETKLYQVRSLKDFGKIKKGDLGGWVQSEDNLSHRGNCWIYDEAIVYGGSKVLMDAKVSDRAVISGNSRISGKSWVKSTAMVDDSRIEGSSIVKDDAEVMSGSHISGSSIIADKSYVSNSYLTDTSMLDNSEVHDGVIRGSKLSGYTIFTRDAGASNSEFSGKCRFTGSINVNYTKYKDKEVINLSEGNFMNIRFGLLDTLAFTKIDDFIPSEIRLNMNNFKDYTENEVRRLISKCTMLVNCGSRVQKGEKAALRNLSSAKNKIEFITVTEYSSIEFTLTDTKGILHSCCLKCTGANGKITGVEDVLITY